jgi:calcyphosin
LSLPEFKKAIKDYRLKFSDNDGARLFKIFDRDGSGSIDYDEFLRQIRVSHLNMEYN